jgi:hypothetical protein
MSKVFDLHKLAEKWPSELVSRSEVARFSGGVLTPKYMANLDSQGDGPERMRIGRKVCYPVSSLVRWMKSRVSDVG